VIALVLLLVTVGLYAGPVDLPTGLSGAAEQVLRESLGLQSLDLVEIHDMPRVTLPPDGRVDFALRPGQPRRGNLRMQGTVYQGETRLYKFDFEARVTLVRTVYLLKNDLKRGDPIRSEDVVPVTRDITYSSDAITDSTAVGAIEATSFIPAGTLLSSRNTKPIPLIRRGDVINVTVRHGGVCLETVAEARQDGLMNDRIVCRNPRSNETFMARITGKTAALIDMEEK
jgi:flagella basal body P-ring formation protein FlgA